jgi:hypothetical protein
MVVASGGSGPFSRNETEAAVARANQYCAEKGQAATISGTNTTGVPGWTQSRSNVQLMCADEKSQQPSVLRPDQVTTGAQAIH